MEAKKNTRKETINYLGKNLKGFAGIFGLPAILALACALLFYAQIAIIKTNPSASDKKKNDSLAMAQKTRDSLVKVSTAYTISQHPSVSGNADLHDSIPKDMSDVVEKLSLRIDSEKVAAAQKKAFSSIAKHALSFYTFLVTIILIIIGVLFYFGTRIKQFLLDEDRDPLVLEKYLRKYADDIRSLGTPRKMKRFSNKVRLQYHLLRSKDVELQDEQINQMIYLLLDLEREPRIAQSRVSMLDYFKTKKDADGNVRDYDADLLNQIYELNRDILW